MTIPFTDASIRMPASDAPRSLFDAFPPTPTEDWKRAIERDLKGRAYSDVLHWTPFDDIEVEPFYRRPPDDLTTSDRFALNAKPWTVRQDVAWTDDEPDGAQRTAAHALDQGAEAIGLQLAPATDADRLRALATTVRAHDATLHLHATSVPAPALGVFLDGTEDAPPITLLFDPFALAVQHGRLPGQAPLDALATLISRHRAGGSRHRLLGVDLDVYHAAGAHPVQELALLLASVHELFAALTDRGLAPATLARQLHVRVAVGTSYFPEIAKLRALRGLVRQVVAAYDAEAADDPLLLQAVTSGRSMTRYAPYVNMLRATTAATAAVLGGCDTLTVRPFTAPQGAPDDFALRIARNTQLILREEAYLDRVEDPAAGAYYIEHLTERIGEAAWRLFQEIEAQGGLRAALRSGLVQAMIREAQQERMEALGIRKQTLVGVNRYPVPDEPTPTAPAVSRRAAPDFTGDAIDALPPVREGIAFEALRDRTAAFADRSGRRPHIHLVLFGHPALRSARANFSRDFFGCAGFHVTESQAFDDAAAAAEAVRGTTADVLVLCSADDAYLQAYPAFDAVLAPADRPRIVVAGNPKHDREALEQLGVDDFIHLGTPLLRTLENYQRELGVLQP